jgi:hypothetical protein
LLFIVKGKSVNWWLFSFWDLFLHIEFPHLVQTLWTFKKSWKPSCGPCLRKWWVHGFGCMWKYHNNINWQKFSCMAIHNSKSKVLEKIYFMYIFYFIFCIDSKLDKKTTLNFLKTWLLLLHDNKDVHYAHGLEYVYIFAFRVFWKMILQCGVLDMTQMMHM